VDQQLWNKQPEETPKAYAAFCIYRDLKPGERSIDTAYRQTLSDEERQKSAKRAPGCWDRWSAKHKWVARVEAYDNHLDGIAQAAKEAEIQRVMSEGYAQRHERVRVLNKTAKKLEKFLELDTEGTENYWLTGPKSVMFNTGMLAEFRAALDDLAKEVGQRVTKSETTINLPKPLSELSDQELAEIAAKLQSQSK